MKQIIYLLLVLLLIVPSSFAFEDTFQYYPGGNISGVWEVYTTASGTGYSASANIVGTSGTYNRGIRLYVQGSGYGGGATAQITSPVFSSDYLAFNVYLVRRYSNCAGSYGSIYIYIYNTYGELIVSYNVPAYQEGLYEIIRTGGTYNLRVEGIDKGIIGSSSNSIGYITFRTVMPGGGCDGKVNYIIIDDISTTGNIIGIGTESTTHDLTESNLQPTTISWTAYSFPFAEFTAAQYNVSVQRYVDGTYTELTTDEVKTATDTTPLQGIKSYTRDINFTDSDTSYGLYWAFLQKDGNNIASDYFFLAPPGGGDTISFTDTNMVIGQEEPILYSISSPNYATYNYHVRVYSSYAQVFSEQVTTDSGTVTWDTTDNTAGLYFAVLSRTAKADATNYDELVYDTASLSANILIKGITYDLQNGSALGGVDVNINQGSTWYNTTSDAVTGEYQLLGLDVNIPTNINATYNSYTHNDFAFTPLVSQLYEIDLYLLNNTPTYSNATILGQVYDYPYHQAVSGATVTLSNDTWTGTNTSSPLGFYIFEELTNDTYYNVNASKSEFKTTENYNVSIVNDSYAIQNILMEAYYTIVITAQDGTSSANIQNFQVTYDGTIYLTTNGSLTIPDILYGTYTIQVAADGYYAVSTNELIDSSRNIVKILPRIKDQSYPDYLKYIVTFSIIDYYGQELANINATITNTNTSEVVTKTSGTDGRFAMEMVQDVPYAFVLSDGIITKEFTLSPGLQYYSIRFGAPPVLFNGATWSLQYSNTTIFFNVTDVNNALTNVTFKVSNKSTTVCESYNNSFPSYASCSPPNLTVPYLVNITVMTLNDGNISISRWISFTVGKERIGGFDENIVSTIWLTRIMATILIIIALATSERNAPLGALLIVILAGMFYWYGLLAIPSALIATAGLLAIVGLLTLRR